MSQMQGRSAWVRVMLVLLMVLAISPTYAVAPSLTIIMEGESPYFIPAMAKVASGVPIHWENPTATAHTVTHDACLSEGPCLFDSGSVAPNSRYSLSGLPPGRYPYHCQVHPIMRGVLTVFDSVTLPLATSL